MYKLIESADYDTLFAAYLADHDHYTGGVFSEYDLIISTLPEGDILLQKLADARGIVSGVRPRYWTSFYWHLVEHITGYTPRGEQTPLNNTAIRWHLYTYLYRHGDTILADPAHPLHPHLHQHWPDATRLTADMTRRLWHYTGQLANLYSHYLNQRPDWLDAWQHDPPPKLDDLLQGSGLKRQPAWLAGHYREHYQQQHRLWHATLAATYAARAERIRTFWHKLAHDDAARDKLPPYIPLYAPTNLTETTLRTLIRLGAYSEIRLYHLTAADGEYSDIVDSRWLRRLKLRDPARAEAQHYDHGNTLLSRYGKQQRDRARLLHAYSTDDNTTQHDAPAITVSNLLSAVQADIRSQNETHTAAAPHDAHDDSLRIHACHGTLRQAETLRGDIIAWLNADPTRRLSDILILLPDPIAEQSVLRAVFPSSGDYDGYRLPARIVGTPDTGTTSLWHSLAGHYTHLNGRYDAPTITDWLHNDDTAQSLGSDHEHIQRITTALIQAGYKRGFDSEHLQQTLHPDDHDHRYTYTYALDRLIAGVLMPDSDDDDNRDTIPLPGLSLADLPVLEALAKHANRSRELRRKLAAHTPAQAWLADIRDTLHRDYQHAHDTTAWQTLNRALTSLEQQLSAHRDLAPQNEQLYLPLPFILDNIETHLSAQQNSREPSGVITIGSLTGLRNLPYKLIAFMNADHDRYPARQNDERYNLIHLDKPRPGDNNREHEDLGALLDLINRAGDALWIYYNSHHDNEPQPPASPVQELLQYLDDQHERATQHLRASGRLDAGQTLPRHYHTEHPADPFQPDKHETRPAPLWENIRTTLQQNTPTATETPPPPVGEGWGGGSKHTTSATINTTPCHTPPHETATDAPSSTHTLPPPVGEGWGGVRPQTALPNSQLVSPDEPPPSQDALASAAGEGWGGGGDRKTTATVASSTNTSPETLANMPPSTREGGVRSHAWLSNSQPAPQKTFLPLHIPPTLAADATPQAPENLTLAQLVRDLQKPASAYARAHHIANTAAQTPPESREPLALYGLDNWQADQHIIAALEQNHPDPATHIARLPAYPGGISGQIQLEQRLATYRARQQTLLDRADLATWPTLREQTLNLGEHSSLTALLPAHSPTWPRLSASRAKSKHHARYWLEHLAWNATDAHGTTLIHYADDTLLCLAPLPAADAQRQLHQWLAVREHLQKNLWLAPLELMQPYLETFTTDKAADKQAALVRDWIHDDSHKNDDGDLWRHLWRGNENILAANIAAALATHAPLLQPLLEHGETLK